MDMSAYYRQHVTIRQAGIQDRILGCEILAQNPGDALDGRLEPLIGYTGGQRNVLHHSATVGVDARRAVDHQVRDRRVEQ